MFGSINPLRHPLSMLAALAVAAVLAAVAWVVTAPSFNDLKRDGDRMVTAAERFRQENGRYPESLAAAGVVSPKSRYGPWRYKSEGGDAFSLSVGDYGKHGFVFYYNSGRGEWYADT